MKVRIEDLAIIEGSPSFREKLHVGRPNIGSRSRLIERINDILDRKWLSNNGYYVQELERKITELIGAKHCIAVCNATMGLEIAARALEIEGEVIVPSFTFIATAHAFQWLGITPVFCDIDPKTHNIDPTQVEEMISSLTTSIVGVHLWGRACDIAALTEIAQKYDLKLLFDAAHAFGCSYKGRMIGNFGDLEVFSFHATKFFNTFEGGAIVTNNDELARKLRLIKNFGFAENIISIGTNGKMNEVSAAMGLTGLESLKEFIDSNYQNYKQYQQELADIPGISLLPYSNTEQCNYQYIVIEVDETMTQISRDQLMEVLWAENILVRRYFHPGCHKVEPYCSNAFYADLRLPETERLAQRVLVLPTGTAINLKQIRQICQIIRLIVTHGKEISARIPLRLKYNTAV